MIKDENLRKQYFQKADKRCVKIRFSPEEMALLETKMKADGWENKSRYIKRKLFGKDVKARINDIIQDGDPWNLENLLIHEARAMAEAYGHFCRAYFGNTDKMYRELKIDKISIDKYSYKTSRSFWKLHNRTEDIFKTIRQIAEVLNVDSYFKSLNEKFKDKKDLTGIELLEYDAAAEIDDIIHGRQNISDLM